MFLGKLNDRICHEGLQVRQIGTGREVKISQHGNPFCGEPLSISWQELFETGVEMRIRCPGGMYLNTLTLRLAEDCTPVRIAAYTANKAQLLSEHRAETGGQITRREIMLPLDAATEELVLECNVCFSDVTIEQMDLYGTTLGQELLLPTPKAVENHQGCFRLNALTGYQARTPDEHRAASIFAQKLYERTGLSIPGTPDGNLRLETDPSIPQNGYALHVTAEEIRVCASDLRGFVMGVETLLKCQQAEGFPCCVVTDAPAMPFRGIHLFLPSEGQMDFAHRLVRHLISPMGYNAIILELGGAMEYRTHPEINACLQEALKKQQTGEWPNYPHQDLADGTVVSQEAVAAFCDYVRSFGIDVIPEVQSLGHVQYLTLAHPEIAEMVSRADAEATDERSEDVMPSGFYPHTYCPSNEKSYELLFDILDEVIQVVRPTQYVHMGHDEVQPIGTCPICRKKDPAQLYAQDVQRIYDHLKQQGLKMMIWSDMLQPVSSYKTVAAIDLLPRDIVMLDFIWYFHPDKDIEDALLAKGYPVAMGNLYSSHYPRYEVRRRKPGCIGGQISAWVSTDEYALAKEGKLYDLLYTAQMLWSEDYAGELRATYDLMVRREIRRLRPLLSNRVYPSCQQGNVPEVLYQQHISLPPEDAETYFALQMDDTCASLTFVHAAAQRLTRQPWVALEKIGWYEVQYADGTAACIPLEYGGNICHWARRYGQPFPHMYYRHNGYCATWFADGEEQRMADGSFATFYRYEWLNPRPEERICRIELHQPDDAATGILVARVEKNQGGKA